MKRRFSKVALAVAALLLAVRDGGPGRIVAAETDEVTVSTNPLYTSSEKIRVQLKSAEYDRLIGDWIDQDPSVINMLNHAKGDPKALPLVQLGTGNLYETIGLFADAQTMIQALVTSKPGKEAETGAFFTLQKVYYEAGEYARSVSSFTLLNKAGKFDQMDEARYLAGQAYLRLNAPDQAVDVLNLVDITTKWGPFARYSLAVAFSQQNRIEEAVRAFRESIILADRAIKAGGIEFSEKVVTVLRARGANAQAAEEQVVEGSETVRKSVLRLTDRELKTLQGLRSRAQLGLGYHYMQFKQYQQAFDALSAVPEEDAYFIEALYGKAWALIYQKKLTDAIVLLNNLLKRANSGQYAYEAYLVIGSCFLNLGAYDRAIKSYRTAQEIYKREREVVRAVAEADFFRDRFELIRAYFILEDEGAADPFGIAEAKLSDFDQKVYANIVSNSTVRDSFVQYEEVVRYRAAIERRQENIVRYQAMIEEKLRTVTRVADILEKEWPPRLKDLLDDYTHLDDRINARGRRFDIWALASPKEAMLLRDLQNKKTAIQQLEAQFSEVQAKTPSVTPRMAADEGQTMNTKVASASDRIERLRRMQRLRAGEAIWRIVSSDPSQKGSRDAASDVRQRRELARLKLEVEKVQKRLEQLRDDVDRVRNRHRDMKVRSNDLLARVRQMMDRTGKMYISMADDLNKVVIAEYRNVDERLERFDLEASYGILTALDKQTGR